MFNVIGNRRVLLILSIFCFAIMHSQTPVEKCKISKSYYDGIYSVTTEDIKCLAKKSDQPNTLFFTFGSWCQPCIYHIPAFYAIEKYYKVDLYVLLVDKEDSHFAEEGRDMILDAFPNAKILVIKDLDRGGKSKKYKDFLAKITPSKFENIDDMSKFIVLNQTSEVQMVTTWKDSKDDPDWKDSKPMVRRIVLPLLSKKATQNKE